MATMPSSLEIAQEATLRPIAELVEELGLQPDEYDLYGKYKAKVDLSVVDRLADRPDGKLICVTAITPTKAGEGKTTTSVSLTQGLGHIGRRVALCLREASLGPVFGIKGGAAGGGYVREVGLDVTDASDIREIKAVGRALNELPAMLERAANSQQADLERRTLTIAGLLEPVLILAMGVVVLLIVLAVLMPIIEINQLVR